MSFTDVVQHKIAERRVGHLTHNEADQFQHLRERAGPLMTAVTALLERLSADPMFYRAMGRAATVFRRSDMLEDTGSVCVRGRAGVFTFRLDPANAIT